MMLLIIHLARWYHYLTDKVIKMNISKFIGQRLQELRHSAHLTQEGLAEKANLSLNFIAMVETGKRMPTIGTLQEICVVLNCSISEFFASKPFMKKPKATGKTLNLSNKEISLLLKANTMLIKRLK